MESLTRPISPFLVTAAAASYLGLKKATLERWRCRGGGPVFHKLGGRCFYRQEDLDAFAEARRRKSTADLGSDGDRGGTR
jgi:hypothetical protein